MSDRVLLALWFLVGLPTIVWLDIKLFRWCFKI